MYTKERLIEVLRIPRYTNLYCQSLGLDSLDECLDREHFIHYPDNISYQFNDVGYRTINSEFWKGDEILCIGDSFTLGMGVSAEQTWPSILDSMGHRCLNFSLNGASNDWIARRTEDLLRWFRPRAIIVHYSFSHRRESTNLDWFDDERTLCEARHTDEDNLNNWKTNMQKISDLAAGHSAKIIHSFITNWHSCPVDYTMIPDLYIHPILKQDYARDGFHYGPLTHLAIAKWIAKGL